MLNVTVTFKKKGTSGWPISYSNISFFQYHDDKLIIIQNKGQNEYQYAANEIVSIELSGFPLGFPIKDKE